MKVERHSLKTSERGGTQGKQRGRKRSEDERAFALRMVIWEEVSQTPLLKGESCHEATVGNKCFTGVKGKRN